MKLGMQSGNSYGAPTFISGAPTVLPTNPNQTLAKLIVKGELGQIVQQWLVLQNKCTLGSASSCALRCQLPGIAPYHALLVMGSRQIFIRALAPKLSRNGVMVNELLLTDEQSTFEVAGHVFELIRTSKPNEVRPDNRAPLSKMKFTLARSMDTNPNRASGNAAEPVAAPIQTVRSVQPLQTQQPVSMAASTAQDSAVQARWISELIQSAMQPLERQLHEMAEPLAAVRSELNKRARRKRQQREANTTQSNPTPPTPNYTTQIDVQPQVAHLPEPIMVPIISPLVEEQLTQQSNSLSSLTERLAELKSNLVQLERTVTDGLASASQANAAASLATPDVSPRIESHLAQQSESLQHLNNRLNGVTQNIGALERVVTENFATVISTTSAPATIPTPVDMEPVHQALQKINTVTDQLQGLATQLDEVKMKLGTLEQTVQENLASTNDLKAMPTPASGAALQQLAEVTDQISLMIQAINQRQMTLVESDEAWRDQVRSQLTQMQSSVSSTESSIQTLSAQRPQILKGTCPTSAALISNGHLRNTQAAPAAAAVTLPQSNLAFEEPAAQSANASPAISVAQNVPAASTDIVAVEPVQTSWQSQVQNEFVGFAAASSIEEQTGFESSNAWQTAAPIAPEPEPAIKLPEQAAASVSEWAVEPTPAPSSEFKVEPENANFIEESIDQGPVESNVAVNELPSWWTDDDKTIYQDDSTANASTDSTWNLGSSIPPESNSEVGDLASEDDGAQASNLVSWGVDTSSFEPSAEGIEAGDAFNELANEESIAGDDESELSSLLERFGFARDDAAEASEPAIASLSEPIESIDRFASPEPEESIAYQEELIEEPLYDTTGELESISKEESYLPEITPEPEPAHIAPAHTAPALSSSSDSIADEGSEEESIEDYMKRLMARMRGGSVEEESKASTASASSNSAVTPSKPQTETTNAAGKIALPAAATERSNASTTSPFNPEEYVPKALAPEKTRNMAAMRELANTSARSAIQVSARRRYGTAIAMKLAIALIGLGVGATLVMINGLNVNIGLIATIASFMVALIWGFDAITTIRPLLFAPPETKNVEPVVMEEPQS